MTRETRQGTHLELPVEVLEELRAEDDDMWRIVTKAVKAYLAVETDSLAALQRQSEMLAEEISELDEEIQSLEKTRDKRIKQKERVETQIERIKTDQQSYNEILDDIIDSLVDDPSLGIASQHSKLEAAAEVRNDGVVTSSIISKVCNDVRSRVAERSVEINSKRLHRDQMVTQTEYEQADEEPVLRSLRGEQ